MVALGCDTVQTCPEKKTLSLAGGLIFIGKKLCSRLKTKAAMDGRIQPYTEAARFGNVWVLRVRACTLVHVRLQRYSVTRHYASRMLI